MDVWIGDNFESSAHRVLVLGESWYGEVEPLCTYIPRWARREINDSMFARLFNAASGFHTARATLAQRLAWWNGLAFYNFVPGTVGDSRDTRPSAKMLVASKAPLREVLNRLSPKGVWIVGKEQAEYSADVVRTFGAACEVTAHTASYGLSSAALAASWQGLLQRVQA